MHMCGVVYVVCYSVFVGVCVWCACVCVHIYMCACVRQDSQVQQPDNRKVPSLILSVAILVLLLFPYHFQLYK